MRANEITPEDYENLLEKKSQYVEKMFTTLDMPTLDVFDSPRLHYRMRAEFRVWHEGDDLYHIMFDQSTKQKYRVDSFPQASKLINLAMARLIEYVKPNQALRHKLFQVDYLSTLSGELVISMLYHKALEDTWRAEAEKMSALLLPNIKVNIIGRARKQKEIIGQDFVTENLTVGEQSFSFKQIENSFTQPNAMVNSKMIAWALDVSKPHDTRHDLLELYCGLGNFTIPLAQNFNNVLATEISKSSVSAAQENALSNNVSNLSVVRISSEEFTQAMSGEREFHRLKDIDLKMYQFDTVFVDPPRSGLDEDTLTMVSKYDNIIYISCNPITLRENLAVLCQSHQVTRFALFDQFPYTEHAECGVYLSKNKAV